MKGYSIYFGDTEVVIATKSPDARYSQLEVDTLFNISCAKVVKKVETDKFIAIVTKNPDATFELLKSQFKFVTNFNVSVAWRWQYAGIFPS